MSSNSFYKNCKVIKVSRYIIMVVIKFFQEVIRLYLEVN